MKLSKAYSILLLLPNALSFSLLNNPKNDVVVFTSSSFPSSSTLVTTKETSWKHYEKILNAKCNELNYKKSLVLSSTANTNNDDGNNNGNDDISTPTTATSTATKRPSNDFTEQDQNSAYINGLLQNLSAALDRWIVNGSLNTVRKFFLYKHHTHTHTSFDF